MTPSQILKSALPEDAYKALPKSPIAREHILNLALGNTVHPITPVSRGYTDNMADVSRFATKFFGPLESGNDAPRGGKLGNWLRLSAEAKDSDNAMSIDFHNSRLSILTDIGNELAMISTRIAHQAAIQGNLNTLMDWRMNGFPHPAPFAVLAAKVESGLSWRQLKDAVRAAATTAI